MLTAPKEENFSAPMVWTDECVLPLAAAGVYPKTRVWGSREKTLPCFGATAELRIELRWGCEKSSGKTAAGSALDYNGNTITKTDSTGTTTYTWDFENRLSSVTLPGSGGTPSFKYDPFGRRIYKSSSAGTSVFAYDGDNLIEETNSSGAVVARYSQGLNIDEPLAMLRSGATSFYNADGLGTITSLANTAGSLAQNYTFDSFGKQTASSGSLTNPFQYTAREFDPETSLYYYRARYYDPAVGRFLSEDPVSFYGGFNFYLYDDNDSVDFTDPWGLCPDDYNPDLRSHGAPHIDRVDPNGNLVGRYRPDGSGIPHKGKLPPRILNSDKDKFGKAADELRKKRPDSPGSQKCPWAPSQAPAPYRPDPSFVPWGKCISYFGCYIGEDGLPHRVGESPLLTPTLPAPGLPIPGIPITLPSFPPLPLPEPIPAVPIPLW